MSTAADIVTGLGGADNITDLEPCITRLRVEVKDQEKVDEEALRATGAFGVVFNFRQNPRRWFCSEWGAGVLGLGEPWRFSPNDLGAIYQNSKAELLRRRK